MCLEDGATYQAVVTTNMGEFTVDLDAEAAPETVNNFVYLARNGYYDETPVPPHHPRVRRPVR